MISEFKEKYRTLSDASIYKIEYNPAAFQDSGLHKKLSIIIDCLNHDTESFEFIKLEFKNVKTLRFVEKRNMENAVIFEALIIEQSGEVVFDFFPIQVDGVILQEDLQSDFSVHAESCSYEVLDHAQIQLLKG